MKHFLSGLKHFFIPTTHNNYRARILHLDFLFLFFAFSILFSFSFKYSNILNLNDKVLGISTDITAEKLLTLTNVERSKKGLPNLIYNDKLAQAAEKKARDMFSENYWAHYSPTGKTPWEFILSEGYKYEYAGENLAKDFMYSGDVVNAWMDSPSHRENLLKNEYSEVGFGVVNGTLEGEELTLVVQMFGKPAIVIAQPITENIQKTVSKNVLASENVVSGKVGVKTLSFNFTLIFFVILGLVLLIDLYFANKFDFIRLTGKNIAHLIFVIFVICSILLVTKGLVI
jgi:hypothetical protein